MISCESSIIIKHSSYTHNSWRKLIAKRETGTLHNVSKQTKKPANVVYAGRLFWILMSFESSIMIECGAKEPGMPMTLGTNSHTERGKGLLNL